MSEIVHTTNYNTRVGIRTTYNMRIYPVMTSRHHVTIPRNAREGLDIQPGDRLEMTIEIYERDVRDYNGEDDDT